jgi:hypothetical protein
MREKYQMLKSIGTTLKNKPKEKNNSYKNWQKKYRSLKNS